MTIVKRKPESIGNILGDLEWKSAYFENPFKVYLKDGRDFIVPEELMLELERAFPSVHVEAVVRAMYGKCAMTPKYRPTARGVRRALMNWCALEAKSNTGRRHR